MTQESNELIREITTPNLPVFVGSCAHLARAPDAKGKGHEEADVSLLQTIFQSLTGLLPSHPTLFRPFTREIQTSVVGWLSIDVNTTDAVLPQEVKDHARELLVFLPQCASKTIAIEAWGKSLNDTIRSLHGTANLVFRSFEEDWVPHGSLARSLISANPTFESPVGDSIRGPFGFPSWSGIDAGLQRLSELLDIISVFICTETIYDVVLSVDDVVDALQRVICLAPPPSWKRGKVRNEVDTSETATLFTYLPTLHAQAIDLLSHMRTRFDSSVPIVLHDITTVFKNDYPNQVLRDSCYRFVLDLLESIGSTLGKENIKTLEPIFEGCVSDILVTYDHENKGASRDTWTEYERTMEALLISILSNVPGHISDRALRNLTESCAILRQQSRAVLSSALNVPASTTAGGTKHSLLPYLARMTPRSSDTEALFRPQMPVSIAAESASDPAAAGPAWPNEGEESGNDAATSVQEEFEKRFGIPRALPKAGAETRAPAPQTGPSPPPSAEETGPVAADAGKKEARDPPSAQILDQSSEVAPPSLALPAFPEPELPAIGHSASAADGDDSDSEMPELEVQSEIGMISETESEGDGGGTKA